MLAYRLPCDCPIEVGGFLKGLPWEQGFEERIWHDALSPLPACRAI